MRTSFLACLGTFLLLCVPVAAHGAFEERPAGARQTAMGGAAHSLPSDLWSAMQNPALLPTLGGGTLGVSILPCPYGCPELTNYSLAVGGRLSFGSAGIYGSGLGFELYREIEGGVAFASEVFPRVSFGLAIRTYFLAVKGYGQTLCGGLAAGMHADLGEGICVGILVDNLLRTTIGHSGESPPQIVAATLSLSPWPGFTAIASLAKDPRFPGESAFGIEYSPVDLIVLCGGASLEPLTFCAGFGIRGPGVEFDYGARWHTDLGLKHALTVSIVLGGDR